MNFIIIECLLAASIGVSSTPSKVGNKPKEVVRITKEMLIGISDDLIRADIAEVDIDPAVFDIPTKPKEHKKNELDEIEFITEADPHQKK